MRPILPTLTARPGLVAAFLFTVGVVLTASLPLQFGAPQPVFHDEFGYIFEAQTFAHGRITNDPPPGPPEFFQTFHQFIAPRYFAKFPPGQGLALALGVLLGQPIIGIWIVNGLWAIALFWMLRGALPPRWALLGAVAGVATYGAFTYWGQTYWGGSVLALGGTLTFGGALRLLKRRGCPYLSATLAGVGCGIMSLTRPLDGLLFAFVPAVVIFGTIFLRAPGRIRGSRFGRAAAFLVPAVLGAGLMLAYNVATTGNPLLFAHRLYDQTFVPHLVLFVWQKIPPANPGELPYLLDYENAYTDSMAADPLSAAQYFANLSRYAQNQWAFFFPWPLLPFLAAAVLGAWLRRDRAARFALASLVCMLVPLCILRFYGFPHYAAAWAAPALLLIIQGARRCCLLFRSKGHLWQRLALGAAVLLLAATPAYAVGAVLYRGAPGWMSITYAWAIDRLNVTDEMTKRVQQTGHRQLIAVIYPPGHNPHDEWVFNTPDAATQPVLWARSLGPEEDRRLFAAFPTYDQWILKTDTEGRFSKDKLRLIYSPPADAASAPAPAALSKSSATPAAASP